MNKRIVSFFLVLAMALSWVPIMPAHASGLVITDTEQVAQIELTQPVETIPLKTEPNTQNLPTNNPLETTDNENQGNWVIFSDYTQNATYYSNDLKKDYIGASGTGGLTYHAWSLDAPDATDFAICLISLKPFAPGYIGYNPVLTNDSGANGDSHREASLHVWKNISKELRSKLILLLCYGMDTDSPSARFGVEDGATYAAMQLLAWEWINGKEDNTYVKWYSDKVQTIATELRALVNKNPDRIDTSKTNIYLLFPKQMMSHNNGYVWGQALIALEGTPVYATGELSVTKTITGVGPLNGWVMELYDSKFNAQNRLNCIARVNTDANGKAIFKDLEANKTYYIREALNQPNATAGWKISYSVLNGTVVANETISVGEINNVSPGSLKVTKEVTSSSGVANDKADWKFELYDSLDKANTGNGFISFAYTDKNGFAVFENLTDGSTYYVREAPAERQNKKGTLSSWTLSTEVLSGKIVAGETVHAGVAKNIAPVSATVTKRINPSNLATSETLKNWRFELYTNKNDATNGENWWMVAYTDDDGIARFENLKANTTYYIREAPANRQIKRVDIKNWKLDLQVLSGSIEPATTKSFGVVTNTLYGSLSVTKKIITAGDFSSDKANWRFELYPTKEAANAAIKDTWIGVAYTNEDGVAVFSKLEINKTYYLREAPANRQIKRDVSGWTLNAEVFTAKIMGENIVLFSPISNTAPGKISVIKEIVGDDRYLSDKANWKFELYSTEEAAKAAIKDTWIAFAYTNEDGVAIFDKNLTAYRTYYVREAPAERQNKKGTLSSWTLSADIFSAKIVPGQIVDASSDNNYEVENIAPVSATVTKQINPSSLATPENLKGWKFELYTDKNNAENGENCWMTAYTNEEGIARFDNLKANTVYYIREASAENQDKHTDSNNWELDLQILSGSIEPATTKSFGVVVNTYTEQGFIKVKKSVDGVVANEETLKDWVFDVFSDSMCENFVTSIITDKDGYGISCALPVGTYYVKESDNQIRADVNLWLLDESVKVVTVTNRLVVNAYEDNGYTAKNILNKRIRLIKTANNGINENCFAQIENNNMYSLAGAQYQIIVDNKIVETITTNNDGEVLSTNFYNVGTKVVIKEIVAPKGYKLDTTEYSFIINNVANEYYEIKMQDAPVFDPTIIRFQKQDASTTVPQGNATFEGAIFRWDYYDNTNWDGDPVRTWYFKTDSTGFYGYDENWLATGYDNDKLYQDDANRVSIPLGSIKITEIVAPVGYKELPVMHATVTQPSMGAVDPNWEYTPETLAFLKKVANGEEEFYVGNEPVDVPKFGKISMLKTEKDIGAAPLRNATFEGCEFAVYNRSENPVKVGDYEIAKPNEICYTLTIGSDGTASTDPIFPVGTYEIKEIKGNDYYQCNTDWSYTFTVDGIEESPEFKITCENTLKPAKINLEKLTTENKPLAGAKFLLEWSINGIDNWKPVSKSDEFIIGGCSSVDENGCVETGTDGKASFDNLYPHVYYKVTEVYSPNGYQLLKDPILVNELKPEDNFETTFRVVNNTIFAIPKTGANDFFMLIPCFLVASVAMFYVVYNLTLPEPKKIKRKDK